MLRTAAIAVGLLLVTCTAAPVAVPSQTAAPAAISTTASSAPITVAPAASAPPIVLPSIAQLSAPSGSVVWALVGATRLFRSTDRGDTWQERPLPPQSASIIVSFIDEREGWILRSGSPATQCQSQRIALWHTADTGATWEQVAATGIADGQCKVGLTFSDASHGFISAASPNDRPLVYRTADGGRSWTAAAALTDPPSFTSHGAGFELTVTAVRAFGSNVLGDVAGNGAGQIGRYAYRSADGGATWTYASTGPAPTITISFVSATRWLQIGAPGESRETTDGGATWHAYTTDYSQAAPIAPAVAFGDAQVGYATVRGAIQRTIDGGAHWTAIRTPGTF